MKWHPARLAVAVPLVVIAAFLAFYGGFIISIIFDDYKDSPDSTYLTVGGTSLAISGMLATAALLTVSAAPHRLGWLMLAVVAFLASALPYASMVGAVGYAANAALALLAVGCAVACIVGSGRGPVGRRT
jgi:peptidoglycan/LPS O-acetylase OafA/YrhL